MSKIFGQFREAIAASELTRYRISKLTGIDEGQLTNFMAGRTGLGIPNLEKLADVLEIEIVLQPKKRRTGVKKHGQHQQ